MTVACCCTRRGYSHARRRVCCGVETARADVACRQDLRHTRSPSRAVTFSSLENAGQYRRRRKGRGSVCTIICYSLTYANHARSSRIVVESSCYPPRPSSNGEADPSPQHTTSGSTHPSPSLSPLTKETSCPLTRQTQPTLTRTAPSNIIPHQCPLHSHSRPRRNQTQARPPRRHHTYPSR